MEVSKEVHVMFQAECVNVMEFGGYSWWIAVILSFKSGGYGTIVDYDRFELGCSIVPQRKTGTRRTTRCPDRYSYGGANSHKSCVD